MISKAVAVTISTYGTFVPLIAICHIFIFLAFRKRFVAILTMSLLVLGFYLILFPLHHALNRVDQDSVHEALSFDLSDAMFWYSTILNDATTSQIDAAQQDALFNPKVLLLWFGIAVLYFFGVYFFSSQRKAKKSEKSWVHYGLPFLLIIFPMWHWGADRVEIFLKSYEQLNNLKNNFHSSVSY